MSLSVPKDCQGINTWCDANDIARPTWYRLKENGQGPRTITAMGKTLVTKEASAEWRRYRTAIASGNFPIEITLIEWLKNKVTL